MEKFGDVFRDFFCEFADNLTNRHGQSKLRKTRSFVFGLGFFGT